MVTSVGVLALQGDSREHISALSRIGVVGRPVKHLDDLDDVNALVVPGGESTTIAKLLKFSGLDKPIAERAKDNSLAIMGTCAGMIISARTILDGRPDQASLGIFDATVRRNAYGRQRFSFEALIDIKGLDEPFPMVFIRGPGVSQTGPGVEVLALWDDSPALCAQGPHLFATFHPELTMDGRIHQLFLNRLEERK